MSHSTEHQMDTSFARPIYRRSSNRTRLALLLLSASLGALLTACGPRNADTAASMGDSAAAGRAAAGAAMAGASGAGETPAKATSGVAMGTLDSSTKDGMDHSRMDASGNADQMFLHMMSDHHRGMIAMAHPAMENKSASAAVRADAKKIDATQDAELATMAQMLKTDFSDPYKPTVQTSHQAMADAMMKANGSAYDRMFYANTVAHHREAVAMIDQYMARLSRSDVKAMAEMMKAEQLREIAEFERKMKP